MPALCCLLRKTQCLAPLLSGARCLSLACLLMFHKYNSCTEQLQRLRIRQRSDHSQACILGNTFAQLQWGCYITSRITGVAWWDANMAYPPSCVQYLLPGSTLELPASWYSSGTAVFADG